MKLLLSPANLSCNWRLPLILAFLYNASSSSFPRRCATFLDLSHCSQRLKWLVTIVPRSSSCELLRSKSFFALHVCVKLRDMPRNEWATLIFSMTTLNCAEWHIHIRRFPFITSCTASFMGALRRLRVKTSSFAVVVSLRLCRPHRFDFAESNVFIPAIADLLTPAVTWLICQSFF